MTETRDKSAQIDDVAQDVKSLLEYAATLGMREVPSVKLPERTAARAKAPAPAAENRGAAVKLLRERMGDCRLCKLHKTRKNIVFGVGNPEAELMFIGEGPGRDEDLQGEPFVGAAGGLLTRIIDAMGYSRREVYIANVVKCRPPENRNPEPDEISACIKFLMDQVDIIRPRVIVCLGGVALHALFGPELKISRTRGKFLEWQGIPVMPTYHPAFLLRNAEMKRPVWEDMQRVMRLLRDNKE